MNIPLWIAQGLLATMYLTVGSMKAFQPATVRGNPRMAWAHGQPDNYIRFVGTTEVLGALGLTLLLGSLAQCRGVSCGYSGCAVCAACWWLCGVVLLVLSIFVVIGRWILFSS